ncbi:DUF1294 domain-containing protein [Salirhabdus sp. Marseille-P4669]|uniref:DUF1294 domain-containing protein n=1 Tax=Salirhabdus sp. Marseille-P4669 TaxID=2042310 RepID=UPI000C7A371C|nr:DUF1294 domain-containing protein [Salirhabdus sp. Marseille-P4669]
MDWLYFYILGINSVGFFLMGIDKHKARKRKWRIQESTLFLVAILGGVIGCIIGMYFFHHKTNKGKFKFGMPVLFSLELTVIIILKLTLS